MTDSTQNDPGYLSLAKSGDMSALGNALQVYRDKLLRITKFRMDSRLKGRLDPEDVIQESFIEATKRFSDYVANQEMPFFLWLRFITVQKLMQLHRKHLGAEMRDAGREISINSRPHPQATSAVLAAHLLGNHTSPSLAAMRVEQSLRLERKLNSLSEVDREIIALRRFERLKNDEVAKLLNISSTAASNRYIRALERLQKELQEFDTTGNN